MKQYRMLHALTGVFYWLGILGLLGVVITLFTFLMRLNTLDWVAAFAQLFILICVSLVLLGLSDLCRAILEISQQLTKQNAVLARIEIKLNLLSQRDDKTPDSV